MSQGFTLEVTVYTKVILVPSARISTYITRLAVGLGTSASFLIKNGIHERNIEAKILTSSVIKQKGESQNGC